MKYILGFFVTILLLILLVVVIFSGGDDKNPAPSTSKALSQYSNTQAEASLTIAGPINYYEEHRVTKVTVGRDVITMEQILGYDGQVVDLKTFPNTELAYAAFLSALEEANFDKGSTAKEVRDDIGRCPLGTRYIYELEENGKQLQRFWSSTCSTPESFLGSQSLTIKLFKRQVPEYNKLDRAFVSSLDRR